MIVSSILAIFRRATLALITRWRNLYYRAAGVNIRGFCSLRKIEVPENHRNILLERCALDNGVVLLCCIELEHGIRLAIGEGTYINRNTLIDAAESVIIGKHVAIGPNCYITDHDHGMDPTKPPLQQPMLSKPTRIGDWVWIGANVVVLKGVNIGERTVVGAGSVVTKDLPSDVIAAGAPARVIAFQKAQRESRKRHSLMPIFSVIIAAYNRADLIGATLDSVATQDFRDFEVIVVDDGSTDNTDQLVASCRDRLPALQYTRQPNCGPSAARNAGLKLAHGTYIVFLDSDDLWFRWTLQTLATAIDAHTQPALIAGMEIQFRDPVELSGCSAAPMIDRTFPDYYSVAGRQKMWICIGAAAIRADVLREIGGMTDLRINAEDSDLWMRLGTARGFVHIGTPPLLGYRQHSNTAVSLAELSFRGIQNLVEQESLGHYPGGTSRRTERLSMLTLHTRTASLDFLQRGHIRWGWQVYCQTFGWNFYLGRVKYLLSFPLLTLFYLFRR